MGTTALTITTALGPYATTGLALPFEAMDLANGNHFVSSGKELLVVRNDDVAAQTITVVSVGGVEGRTGDITAFSIPAAAYAIFGPFPVHGWRNAAGNIEVTPSDVDLKAAVIKMGNLR